MDEVQRGRQITALEWRRQVCEIEGSVLNREMSSLETTTQARQAAMKRRIAVLDEWAEIVQELRVLRRL